MILRTKTQFLHYKPTRHGFFTGANGRQVLARVTYLFGMRVWIKELDSEIVPHFHYVQMATLGCSEWRSRIVAEFKEVK